MEIRKDFESAKMLLHRLVQYSMAFNQNNMEHWPHLKNNEDFHRIYDLEFNNCAPLESIYCDGRDIAVFMSSALTMFNYSDTLK